MVRIGNAALGMEPRGVASLPQDVQRLSGLWGNHRGEAITGFQTCVGGGSEFRQAPMQGKQHTPLRQRDLVHLLARKAGSLVDGKLQDDRRFQEWPPWLTSQIPLE